MKIHIPVLLSALLGLTLTSAHAQPGRAGGMGGIGNGAQISAAMSRLFGKNQEFSANLENEIQMPNGGTLIMSGKISFDAGKARFDMDLSEAKGTALPPQMIAQMKSMSMDKIITISRPDEKLVYLIYPGLKAYAEIPNPDSGTAKSTTDFKIETTELGKETLDGHPCIKNKALVTDADGKTHESTEWNATDLKDFPVKIQTTEQGTAITMSFKNVKLTKPAASLFDPPSDYKKYSSMMEMMQQEVMKRMGGGPGAIPPPEKP